MTNGNRNKRNVTKTFVWAVLIILALGGICIYPELLGAQQETNKEATAKLLSTVSEASAEEVARLIQEGADVNAVDGYGWTPLMLAARDNSSPDVLQVLIEGGANVNAVDKDRETPLMHAACNNSNPEVLRVLIEGGADVNAVDEDGWTPLELAASDNENPEVLRVLIEGSANVNYIDRYDRTLLTCAAFNSNSEVLRALIEGGVDINAVDINGWTPLMHVVNVSYYGGGDDGIVRLIEEGADVNAVNSNGLTALWIAFNGDSGYNYNIIKLLIDNGADANAVARQRGIKQRTKKEATEELLFIVSDASLWEVIQLIQEGADVNAIDEFGWTPIMLAAMGNPDYYVLRFLIEEGANVNAVDINGWTPLMLANWYNSGDDNKEKLLINNGADVNMTDKKGRRAFKYNNENLPLTSQLMEIYVKEIDAYRIRGTTFIEGAGFDLAQYGQYGPRSVNNLDQYDPWSTNSLARLDSPATLCISGDYPILDGRTSAYPLYAAVANEVYEVDNKKELKKYLRCSTTERAYENIICGEVDIAF